MSDYSIYPVAIDGYSQLPLVIDNVTRVDAITVNRLRSAIINIENELGVDPSDSYDTVKERLDAIENLIQEIISDGEGISLDFLGYKNPVRVATTGNISNLLTGAPNIIDGITLEERDRILVHQQTSAASNGIYEVITLGSGSDGSWTRTSDSDSVYKLIPGSEVYVVEGDTYGTTKFWLVTPGPYILDTTSLQFVGGLTVMQSDSEPTIILNSTAIGASEATATSTDSISVRNFREIDFSFSITNLASISEIRTQVLYSLLSSPGDYDTNPEDWNLLLAEQISTGIASVDPYTLSLTLVDYPLLASAPGSFALRSPVVGLHMMILIWAESGSSTGSVFQGYALRRI